MYDWECSTCGSVREHVVEFPQDSKPPKLAQIECDVCASLEPHERLISLPAEYHGERVLNPVVSGGAFDTAGQRALPALPDLPSGAEERASNYKQLFETAEYKEAKRERSAVMSENAAKRKRLQAIRAGANINMRRDRLPGDPKLTA